ncbi:hypothetical protein ACH4XT_29025 [Streptomyces avidinii]|uniref:hypothetical protein n=1 Tax=Streptomyces avidinii TaxID=1895 RepID=UPI0037B460C0
MSTELFLLVALDEPWRTQALALHERSTHALARAAKAPPGERIDVVRHERAQSDLEALALAARNAGAPWAVTRQDAVGGSSALVDPGLLSAAAEPQCRLLLDMARSGSVIVAVTWPFAFGQAVRPAGGGTVVPSARRWTAAGRSAKEAVQARLRNQIEVALAAAASPHETPASPGAEGAFEAVAPSGVPNSALTAVLREFAAAVPGKRAVEVPVRYRDGSRPRAFPFGAVPMGELWQPHQRLLRFVLLSIRHVELDGLVDGAWLRNADISRPRPMALTDELVYSTSREQLAALTRSGPVSLMMYQTGLEPAVVGFYRAVVDHLCEQPASIAVQPVFYRRSGPYGTGIPWRSP